MLPADVDMKEWKTEVLNYFQSYLKNFKKGTPQHSMIKRRIKELESLL